MGLRVRCDLLPKQAENIGLQENIQIEANKWVVPSAVKLINLTMKKKNAIKKELIDKENLADRREESLKVSCKICDKELFNTNLGKHTYKVHCLTLTEYQEIYGKLSQKFSHKRKMNSSDQCVLSRPEPKKLKTEHKSNGLDFELSRVETYKMMSTKELLEELEKVLAA